MRWAIRRAIAPVAAIFVMVSAAMAGTPASPAAGPAAPAAETPRAAPEAAKAVEAAIEQAADKVSPAVVNILVVREVTEESLLDEGSDVPDDLKEFLDRFRRTPHPPFKAQGNGSGAIISPDGFILTSEHVIRDAVEIHVTLANRKPYRAKPVGSDPRRDLAVIRIEAADLPVLPLGDAAQLRRGQFVLALGSPFGFGRDGQASLSFGIVSGTGRAIPGVGRQLDRYYGNLIQTDAAINPGNSGGPLVNLDGQIVGVNVVISSQSGASEGVGFAVPITAETRRIIERLKRGETITYGYLGIEIQDVDEEHAKAAGAEAGMGAYVARVIPDAPAAKGGVKDGDVIVAVGDAPVRDPDDVIQIVQATPVGEKLTLTVLRSGRREKIAVEVAQRPTPREALAAREGGLWWRGMRVEPLTEELRTQTGLKETEKGVFVREVRDLSPAAEAEMVPGMVIDEVGGKKVTSPKEFSDAVGPLVGPVAVHVVGIGAKTIPAPAGPAKPEGKAAPEKPKTEGGKDQPETKPEGDAKP
jgi:serine protease Do